MLRQISNFIISILPGFLGILSFFNNTWSNTTKFILALSLSSLYFLGLIIYLHFKLNKVENDSTSKDFDFNQLKDKKLASDKKIEKYNEFVHKRRLFIEHDLPEIGQLITEYEGNVKNTLRGQKYQEVRVIASTVKDRTNDVIKKEKRDFDEQLFNIQSD